MIKPEVSIQIKSHFKGEKKENYGSQETAVTTVKQNTKTSNFWDLSIREKNC